MIDIDLTDQLTPIQPPSRSMRRGGMALILSVTPRGDARLRLSKAAFNGAAQTMDEVAF